MRQLLPFTISLALAGAVYAQYPGLTLPPSGNNQKAKVTQWIGPVEVEVEYSSPAVHGPDGTDRRGQIWGKLVPYGETDLGFHNGKPSPWRAGANENTVFAVSEPITVEGQQLPAGRYGLHMIPGAEEWTVVFSKNSSAWGSFFYDSSDDALRVKVKPAKHEYREWLTYDFTKRKPKEATLELQWEELAVPIALRVDDADEIYYSKLRRELTGGGGFDARAYDAAALYLVGTGTHLEDALQWSELAINMPFVGVKNFQTLDTKSQVLAKMGRDKEAQELLNTAARLPGTTLFEVHQAGRQLLTAKNNEAALELFKLNAERNGDVWPVNVGLARGYMAVGDYPKALEYAKKAVAQAPDPLNRGNLEAMVKTLSEGKAYDK